jgi:hypothetical protein
MHAIECLELAGGVYGGARLLLDLVRARRRRRVHREVARAGAAVPAALRCPVVSCVGHSDAAPPAYLRGHPQPCWDGNVDPRREERV